MENEAEPTKISLNWDPHWDPIRNNYGSFAIDGLKEEEDVGVGENWSLVCAAKQPPAQL